MSDVTIRWAQADDARGVAIVHVDAWRTAYPGLIEQHLLDGLQVDERADGWSRWIARSLSGESTDDGSTHRLLVAELDRRIVGWASFGTGRDEGMTELGELAGLYVHPDHWSHGVGHTLLERVEQELHADGRHESYLWVLHGNERAIRFYEKHGWKADGTREDRGRRRCSAIARVAARAAANAPK